MVAKLKNSVTKLISQCEGAEGRKNKTAVVEVFSAPASLHTLNNTCKVLNSLQMRILKGLILSDDKQRTNVGDLEQDFLKFMLLAKEWCGLMINLTALLGKEMCVDVLVDQLKVHRELMVILNFTRDQQRKAEQDPSLYPSLDKIEVDNVM